MIGPKPVAEVRPNGTITFPRSESGALLRDHAFVQAMRPAPCPGGTEFPCAVMPGQLMVAFLCRPENLMVLGCPFHVFEFAARRGAAKRKVDGSFLQSGLLVGPEEE
jgi:hypothetical protein